MKCRGYGRQQRPADCLQDPGERESRMQHGQGRPAEFLAFDCIWGQLRFPRTRRGFGGQVDSRITNSG